MNQKESLVEQLQIINEIHCRKSVKSLYYTMKLLWDVIIQDKFIDNWHIPFLCQELEYVGRLAIARKEKEYDLLINIPPGTSKSTIVTIMWDVHNWIVDPSIVTINSSYSSGLSTDHSLKFSSIINSEIFNEIFQPYYIKKFGKYLKLTKDTESIVSNNFGGSRISTSTGGTITGKHGHIIKRDDPLDPEQAESKAYRERAIRFCDRTLSSRKKQKESTVTVTVMQRLHELDITGNELKKDKKLKHINLPATINEKVKPVELREKYINGLLDPNRLNEKIIKEAKIDLGSYGYSGQYMQDPTPEGGGKIKINWFNYINENQLPKIKWDLWVDGAYTKQTENDPTGLMVCGIFDGTLYIKHASSKHMDMPELLKFIPEYSDLNGVTTQSRTHIEPKASGLSLIQMLNKDTYLNAIKIKGKLVSEGKEARVQTAAPKIESGKVILVKGSWNDEFTGQLIGFPNMEHDEYVDLIGYACRHYFIRKRRQTK